MKKISYILYYRIAIHLPNSGVRFLGHISKRIRYRLCRRIFKYCGENVNIESGVHFGYGDQIQIGDNSGLGINCTIPNGSIIGKDVIIGPNCYIHGINHVFNDLTKPIRVQGVTESIPIVIEDDVWIGRDVSIMRGRTISKGSIIAANCVLTKDFPPYSIVGGNPSQLIRSRK